MEFERKFCATVNGKRRSVILYMPRGYANDVEEAELMVMNDEPLYRAFYAGAVEADYNAELVNVKLIKLYPRISRPSRFSRRRRPLGRPIPTTRRPRWRRSMRCSVLSKRTGAKWSSRVFRWAGVEAGSLPRHIPGASRRSAKPLLLSSTPSPRHTLVTLARTRRASLGARRGQTPALARGTRVILSAQ